MLTKRLGVTTGKETFEAEIFVWHMRMMDAVISGLDRALFGFASVSNLFFTSINGAKLI